MRTFPRPNKLRAFGLVDTLVALLVLVATVAVLVTGFSTLLTLGQRQDAKIDALVKAADASPYAPLALTVGPLAFPRPSSPSPCWSFLQAWWVVSFIKDNSWRENSTLTIEFFRKSFC